MQEIRADDYVSASRSCKRAKQIGWVFQRTGPVKYAEVLGSFGLTLIEQQHYSEARLALEEALRRMESQLPAGSHGHAIVLAHFGLLNLREGNLKDQEVWYRKAYSALDALGLKCDRGTATVGANLGSALGMLGRLDEAEAVLQARISRNDDCPDLAPYVRGSAHRLLGEIQTRLDKEETALTTFERAMNLLRQAQGESSLELAYTLISRAVAWRRLERHSEAERDLKRALPMLTQWVGTDSPEVGTAHSVLGNSLRMQEKYDQALAEYRQAERIYRNRLGPNHPWLATLELQMSRALKALGQHDEAKRRLADAERIRIATFGAQSPQVQRVRDEADSEESQ